MTIWRMRIACWIPKATDTGLEHVILTAFLQQKWLRERGSVLRYMYIACLVQFTFSLCQMTQDIERLEHT